MTLPENENKAALGLADGHDAIHGHDAHDGLRAVDGPDGVLGGGRY
jgi:hypothetical protein